MERLKQTAAGSGVERAYVPRQKMSMYDQILMLNACLALDVDVFRQQAKIFRIPFEGQSDESCLKTMHIIRINSPRATDQQKRDSENWLRFRNVDWKV
jgi:hypothetical protein